MSNTWLLLAALIFSLGMHMAEAVNCDGADETQCTAAPTSCEWHPPWTYGSTTFEGYCAEKPKPPDACCKKFMGIGRNATYGLFYRCSSPNTIADNCHCEIPVPDDCVEPLVPDATPETCCQSRRRKKLYRYARNTCPYFGHEVALEDCIEIPAAKTRKYSVIDVEDQLQNMGVLKASTCAIGIGLVIVMAGGFFVLRRRTRAERGAGKSAAEHIELVADDGTIE